MLAKYSAGKGSFAYQDSMRPEGGFAINQPVQKLGGVVPTQ